MSITLTISILIAGAVAYLISGRLVRIARILGAGLLMIFLAAIVLAVQNQSRLFHVVDPEANLTFEKASEQDHHFLDSLLEELGLDSQKRVSLTLVPRLGTRTSGALDPTGKPDLSSKHLVINTAPAKRAEPVIHSEIVRRAELVRRDKGKTP